MTTSIRVSNRTTSAVHRTVEWIGDPQWPGIPPVGAVWFHCGEWAGEHVANVHWAAPPPKDTGATVHIEILVGGQPDELEELFEHLVQEHGFVMWGNPRSRLVAK